MYLFYLLITFFNMTTVRLATLVRSIQVIKTFKASESRLLYFLGERGYAYPLVGCRVTFSTQAISSRLNQKEKPKKTSFVTENFAIEGSNT